LHEKPIDPLSPGRFARFGGRVLRIGDERHPGGVRAELLTWNDLKKIHGLQLSQFTLM
jgi:hypothetical protein